MLLFRKTSDEKCAEIIFNYSLQMALNFEEDLDRMDRFVVSHAKIKMYTPIFTAYTARMVIKSNGNEKRAENIYRLCREKIDDLIKSRFPAKYYDRYCERSVIIENLLGEIYNDDTLNDYETIESEVSGVIVESIKSDDSIVAGDAQIFDIITTCENWKYAFRRILRFIK